MELEGVKINNLERFLKLWAKVFQLIKMETSPSLSEKFLLSFGWEGKGN